MEVKRVEYKCMNCDADFTIPESECKDGMNCPGCRGPIRAIGFETITVYTDGEPIKEPPLLTIELDNETAAPKVFYNGEEVTNKVRVSFDWVTSGNEQGGTKYNIEHTEVIDKQPINKGIGLARGKYGLDQQ